jgi:hypothetical protein
VFVEFVSCIVIAVLFFGLLVALTSLRVIYTAKNQPTKEQKMITFRHRVSRNLVLVCYLFYHRTVIYAVDTMHCKNWDGVNRLVRDPSYVCYSADHIALTVLACMVLVIYLVGFPVFATYEVYRHRRGIKQRQMASALDLVATEKLSVENELACWQHKWSFLVRNLRPGMEFFRCVQFVGSFVLGLGASVFRGSSGATLLLSFVFFMLNFVAVLYVKPFETKQEHVSSLLTGLLRCIGIFVLVGIVVSNEGWDNFHAATGILTFLVVVIVGGFVLRKAREIQLKNDPKDQSTQGIQMQVTVTSPPRRSSSNAIPFSTAVMTVLSSRSRPSSFLSSRSRTTSRAPSNTNGADNSSRGPAAPVSL